MAKLSCRCWIYMWIGYKVEPPVEFGIQNKSLVCCMSHHSVCNALHVASDIPIRRCNSCQHGSFTTNFYSTLRIVSVCQLNVHIYFPDTRLSRFQLRSSPMCFFVSTFPVVFHSFGFPFGRWKRRRGKVYNSVGSAIIKCYQNFFLGLCLVHCIST